MTPAQEYRLGVRAAVLIIAGLCGLSSVSVISSGRSSHNSSHWPLMVDSKTPYVALRGRMRLAIALCVLASLSGCLTASKIYRWESALLGWARKGGPECKEAVKPASQYLVNANRTLQGATSALDLAADGEAKKLMQDAAQKCGEVVP